jgi:hypothetical protein
MGALQQMLLAGRGTRTGYTTDVVPTMTSASAPSGTVTTNDETNGAAWKVFSDANEDGSSWNTAVVAANPTSKWVAYEFTAAKIIEQYTVKVSASFAARGPKSWKFQGWNGAAYVDLDTRTAVAAWSAGERRAYDVVNATAYSKYRLEVTELQNPGNTLIIEEIEMMEGIYA